MSIIEINKGRQNEKVSFEYLTFCDSRSTPPGEAPKKDDETGDQTE